MSELQSLWQEDPEHRVALKVTVALGFPVKASLVNYSSTYINPFSPPVFGGWIIKKGALLRQANHNNFEN